MKAEAEERQEEEVIKVVDKVSAKRRIEMLNMGIAIQDLASSDNVRGVDILHFTKEKGDSTLKRVIMRMKDNAGALVVEREFTWHLTTPKSKLRRRKS